MRARNADWHATYTLPTLMEFFQPSRDAHGSYWFDWTTADEVAWRNFYRVWMSFVNDYKNRGGRVTTGSDSGYIYKLYGFGYVEELELLQEAGFHPLEVIRAATLHGAEIAGRAARAADRVRRGPARHARRPGRRRPEPARRTSRCSTAPAPAAERPHRPGRARRRREVHHQGRHRLRRAQAARRRRGDGRRAPRPARRRPPARPTTPTTR